nr:MAG TPA: hypothetical protein [Caudoviricetes sp.]
MKTETRLLKNVPVGINGKLYYADIKVYHDLPEAGLELLRKFKELPLKYQKKALRYINKNYGLKKKKADTDNIDFKN